MINILSEQGLAALARFARVDTLLGLDYDGTLVAIKSDRDAARLTRSTRRLLAAAAQLYPTVIITGRSRNDMLQLLGDIPNVEVIGSHGVETAGIGSGAYEVQVDRWFAALNRRLADLSGIVIEHKRLSLSIHYRAFRPRTVARTIVLDAVSDLEGARVLGGKAVVNVVPQSAPNKGGALVEACERSRRKFAIFAGDDETDEDVFALNRPDTILSVRVGYRANSGAPYFLRRRAELNEMLKILIHCRVVSNSRFRNIPQAKRGFH